MTSSPNTAVLPSGTMLDGITLREYIERSGKQPTETVINLFRPIFAALEHIHSAGVIHRDISPDNLMLRWNFQKRKCSAILFLRISELVFRIILLKINTFFLSVGQTDIPVKISVSAIQTMHLTNTLYISMTAMCRIRKVL